MELLFSSAWLAIVVWLLARAIRQRGLLPPLQPAAPPDAAAPRLAVIVPARDEETNIERCVRSVLAQDDWPGGLPLIVVDDHSADATAAIVERLARADPRLTLIKSPPLPPRWVGKSHACWIGTRAIASETEWLCFIDADVTLAPGALSSAVHAARDRRLDLLSLMPRQELKSVAERLILPCGLILLSFFQDLAREQKTSGGGVTATGQFMLLRRQAYETAGGHEAVHTAICEDLELARRLKQSGYAVLLMDGSKFVTARMYTGWRTLWPGLAKNLVDTLGGPGPTLAVAFAAVVLSWAAFVIPLLDLVALRRGADHALGALILALLGSGAAIGLHVAAGFYFRIPFWYGLIFPLGYSIGALMALDSVGRRLRGRVSWKGRTYS